MRGYLTRGKPLGVQGQHDLVHIVQPPLPFFDDDRLGRAVPVTRHLDGDGPHAVGRDRLDGGAVARIRAASPRAFLVLRASGMLGHLLVQSGLRHGPGDCLSGPSGPVGSSPRSFARLIISNASSRSAAPAPDSSRFPGFAAAPLPAAGFVVMVSIVSVGMLITGPFPTGPATGDQDQLHTPRDSPCKSAF